MRWVIEEIKQLAGIFLFLFLFLGAFAAYRRLVLEEHGIAYAQYGFAAVEALVLAKVLLIGRMMHLGRRFQDQPLVVSTLYQTLVFSLFVLAFSVLEHIVLGLAHGEGVAASVRAVASAGKLEILARVVVILIALIPFFALSEIDRVLGEGSLAALFFRRRDRRPGR